MAIIFGTGFQAQDCEPDVGFFLLLLHVPNLLNRNTDLLLLADFLPIALLCVLPSFCGTLIHQRSKPKKCEAIVATNHTHRAAIAQMRLLFFFFFFVTEREFSGFCNRRDDRETV
jgi:hypothetical protein